MGIFRRKDRGAAAVAEAEPGSCQFTPDRAGSYRSIASINDMPIDARDRKYHWPLGRRPDDHPGLSDLGL